MSGQRASQRIDIRREPLSSAAAVALIDALNDELQSMYPEEGANHFRLDAHEVAVGAGAFLVCYADGEAVACGAVRKLDAERAELKRMYAIPGHRGSGLGRMLLAALESEAAQLLCTRLVLETGERQVRAVRLYRAAGFVEIERFGEYENSPLSVCMEKPVRSSGD